MNNADFLLYDFKFDSTVITYSYSHAGSLWDGYDDLGNDQFFDAANKASLAAAEQAFFTAAVNAWENYSVFSISSASGTGDINIYNVEFISSTFNGDGATPWFENDTDTSIVDGQNYSGLYERSEIAIADDFSITASGSYGYFVALHEFGHALGLDHPNGNGLDSSYDTDMTVMSYNVPNGRHAITPMAFDILALEENYSAPSYNSGNGDVYEYVASTTEVGEFSGDNRAQTLMDTGGVDDEISFAGYSSGPTVIDLRKAVDENGQWTGYHSQIGDEYIYIAHNTDIENATGSTQDDHIIGNDLGNTIDGGAGDDTIEGKGGNDNLNGGQGNNTYIAGSGNDVYVATIGSGVFDYSGFATAVHVEGDDFLTNKWTVHKENSEVDQITTGGASSDYTFQGTNYNDVFSGTPKGPGAPTAILDGGEGIDIYETPGLSIVSDSGSGKDFFVATISLETRSYLFALEEIDGVEHLVINSSSNVSNEGYQTYIDIENGGIEYLTLNGRTLSTEGLLGLFGNPPSYLAAYGWEYGIESINQLDDLADQIPGIAGAGTPLIGTDASEVLDGTSGNDFMLADAGNDTLNAGAGDDALEGGAGDDILNGGADNDTAIYTGVYANFAITTNANDITVNDNVGNEGTDTVSDVETLEFADGSYDVATATFTQTVVPQPVFLEAEDLPLTNAAVESRGSSSNGLNTVVSGASGSTGVIETVFAGNAGTYNLNIAYYDENDGVSSFDLKVNGVSVTGGQWDADQDLGSAAPVASTLTSQLITNLSLTTGDLIELHATKMDGEGARVDTFSFTPATANTAPEARNDVFSILEDTTLNANVLVDNGYGADSDPEGQTLSTQAETVTSALGVSVTIAANGDITYVAPASGAGSDSFTYTLLDGFGGSDTATAYVNVAADDTTPYTWEAESMILGGSYEVVANAGASNGAFVQVPGSGQTGTITIASNFTGADGYYDLDVFYWDENDGESAYTLEVIRGGVVQDTRTWVADEDYGVAGSNSTNRVSYRAVDLELETDDLIVLTSGHDGGENARVDNFVFMPLAGQGQGGQQNQPTTGDDVINGTTSAETISALAGNDIVNGNGGGDTLNGDEGNDELYGADGFNDILNGGTGDDLLHGRSGDDTLNGNEDNDEIWGFSGDDAIDGGSGTDSVHYNTDPAAINVDLVAGTVTDGYGDVDTVTGIEKFYGSSHDDTMQGDASGTEFRGQDGNDTLKGGAGNDTLLGNNGDDLLYGEDGYDVLQGYDGADTFFLEDVTAFNNTDRIKDFDASEGDIIDISDVLDGHYDSATDTLTDFVKIEQNGTSSYSYLSVDLDGAANGANFTNIARLDGLTGTTDVSALELAGNLKTEAV